MSRLICVLVLLAACHEEAPIVIKFEPSDLSAKAAVADLQAAHAPVDAAVAKAAPDGGGKKAVECKAAAECVVEPAECCDCANGGKQHAIPKARAEASKRERVKRCQGTMCTMMVSTDPTCGQRADCVAGACVMVAAKPTVK